MGGILPFSAQLASPGNGFFRGSGGTHLVPGALRNVHFGRPQ